MNDYSNEEERLVSWFQENYKNILAGIAKLHQLIWVQLLQ